MEEIEDEVTEIIDENASIPEIQDEVELEDNKKDLSLIAVALLVVGITSYLLFFSKNDLLSLSKDESENKVKLAKLVEKTNSVQRKSDGDVDFIDVNIQDDLYQNDQVFTKKGSTGKIQFADGTIIEMSPNTLLKIESKEGKSEVNLLNGYMLAKMSDGSTNPNITIKSGNTELDLSTADANTQIQIGSDSKNVDGKSTVTLLSGGATVKVGESGVRLDKNQELEVDKTGQTKVNDLAISLLSPPPQERIFYHSKYFLKYKWKTNKKVEKFRITIAKDPMLKNVIVKKDIFDTEYKRKIEDSGNIYWKVESYDEESGKNISSQVFSFIAVKDSAPAIISPLHETVISIKRSQRNDPPPIILSWQPQVAQGYDVEVKKGSRTIKEFSVKETNQVNFKMAKAGNSHFFWRVRANDYRRPNAPWSDWNKFSTKILGTVLAPTDLSPMANKKIPIGKNFDEPISFSWEGDDSLSYRLQVAIDKDFKKVIFVKDVNNLDLQWQSRVFGQYYWRVGTKLLEVNNLWEWSNSQAIQIIAAAPELTSPPDDEEVILYEPGPVEFRWEEVYFENSLSKNRHPADIYVIEGSKEDVFESYLFRGERKDPFYTWQDPKFGNIHWRVKARPNNSDGLWSTQFKFKLKKSPPPAPPDLSPSMKVKLKFVQPQSYLPKRKRPGRSIAGIFGDRVQKIKAANTKYAKTYVELKWPRVQYVKSYELEVYSDDDMSNRLIKLEITNPIYIWRNPKPGEYYMRVRSIDKWNQKGAFSDLTELELVMPDRTMDEPVLTFPKNEQNISYDKKFKYVQFIWDRLPGALDYHFFLSKTADFNQNNYYLKSSLPYTKINPNDQQLDGLYYWKVRAIYPYGSIESQIAKVTFLSNAFIADIKDIDDDFAKEVNEKSDVFAPKKKVYIKVPASLALNYTPTNTSYSIASDVVSGETQEPHFISFAVDINYPFTERIFANAEINNTSGTTFNPETEYSKSEYSLYAGYLLNYEFPLLFSAALGGHMTKTNSAFVDEKGGAATTSLENSTMSFGLKLFAQYHSDTFTNSLIGEATFTGTTIMSLAYVLTYQKKATSQWFYNFGGRYTLRSFTLSGASSSAEVNLNTAEAILGMGYAF